MTKPSDSPSDSLSDSTDPSRAPASRVVPRSPSPSEGNHSASPHTSDSPSDADTREPLTQNRPQQTAVERLANLQRNGGIMLCGQRGPIDEQTAEYLLELADTVRSRTRS